MIALIQRVTQARVEVGDEIVGEIGAGLLVLSAVQRADGPAQVTRMAERLLNYRVFADGAQRMNLSVRACGGALLLVPQFTLAADTSRGNRPSFTPAAEPEAGRILFDALLSRLRELHSPVESGRFGADMRVHLVNDGPVTFWLEA